MPEEHDRYQLRYAAGMYWLLDMRQSGIPFRKPLILNEAGALIWTMLRSGREDRIADTLCAEYQVSEAEVLADVAQFRETLRKQGIEI